MGKGTAILAGLLAAPLIAGGVIAAVPKFRTTALDWISKHSDIYKTAIQNNEDLQAENEDLQTENETLAADKTALQAQVTSLTADKTALQTQLTAKSSQLEQANARIAELVAQAEENNQEFQFGTYVSSMLHDDDERFADGYYDDTFAEINNNGTGRMFYYDENGDIGYEPFTYTESNDKIIVEFEDPETHEIVETYELTLSNGGYFDLLAEEGEEPIRFVYCNEELHDAILARHNLRWQVVNLSNQITTLNDRIAELESQLEGNHASYSVTRRQLLGLGFGGFGFSYGIDSSSPGTVQTEEQYFSGSLGSLEMFGQWNNLNNSNISFDSVDTYTFTIGDTSISSELTANHVDYNTTGTADIHTHLFVNGDEILTSAEVDDISFDSIASYYITVEFTLNENQMITELTVNCYVTGEVTPISEEQEGPVQETQYSLQYGVLYNSGNGSLPPIRFANDGTFEFVTAPAPTAGTYVGFDTNYYSLEVNGNPEGTIHLLSDSSLEFNGSVYTAVQQQISVYSLQTNVDYTNGTDTFVFNDDNTFEYTYYVVGAGDTTKTGTYSSDGANIITLAWDDDSPSQQFVLSDNDSFDFYGSTFTVVIPEPGGNN